MQASSLRQFGIAMFLVTILAQWIQILYLHMGNGSVLVTGLLGLLVGLGGFVLGDIRSES